MTCDTAFVTPPNWDVSNCVARPLILDTVSRMSLIPFRGVCRCTYILRYERKDRVRSLFGARDSLRNHLFLLPTTTITAPPLRMRCSPFFSFHLNDSNTLLLGHVLFASTFWDHPLVAPMPRITLDPSLEVRPDFTSAAFDAVCTAVATAEGIEEVLAAWLSDAWDMDNNTRREAWANQVREDEAAAAEARLAREADQLRELEELKKEEEGRRRRRRRRRRRSPS